MPTLTCAALSLLLLLPSAASAQDLAKAVSAVVRISGTRGGTPVRGSGFVVSLNGDRATIVTASHVIEGMQKIEVIFAAAPAAHFPAEEVLGMDPGSPNGLAAFLVQGALPSGITALSFEVATRPQLGDELFLVGFPTMELAPRTPRRVLSGRSGMLLLIDQRIGEGFSGGPVLQGGKVVGVVTDTDDQTTYAVNAVVAHEALEGWRVNLSGPSTNPLPNTVTQTAPKSCRTGEESPENGITWVHICGGTFTMGSAKNDPQALNEEKPTHRVTVSEFWIGKTEITNEQYRSFRSDHQGEAKLPATYVSWDEAKATCEHFGGRLPTEAEWEYAARADSKTAWSVGDDEKLLEDYAWYDKNSGNVPHPVGTKKADSWGLYDMSGNVWEWAADWYRAYSGAAQIDTGGPATGTYHVSRGGAFEDPPRLLRSAVRLRNDPSYRARFIGFRCARGSRG